MSKFTFAGERKSYKVLDERERRKVFEREDSEN
jgi:hypothetical protein